MLELWQQLKWMLYTFHHLREEVVNTGRDFRENKKKRTQLEAKQQQKNLSNSALEVFVFTAYKLYLYKSKYWKTPSQQKHKSKVGLLLLVRMEKYGVGRISCQGQLEKPAKIQKPSTSSFSELREQWRQDGLRFQRQKTMRSEEMVCRCFLFKSFG